MTRSPRRSASHAGIYVLVTGSGIAALSWEVLWQIKASLALGVSAWGTALTLAITMGGMGAGALLMGRWLEKNPPDRPLRLYGFLELVIGISGLLLDGFFNLVEKLDTFMYSGETAATPLVYILGITASLGLPALCMGATLPVLGLAAKRSGAALAVLYGLNTLGAAAGVLLAAFLLIPGLGLLHTGWLIAGINIAVGLCAMFMEPVTSAAPAKTAKTRHSPLPPGAQLIVCATGFATLALEVAWFRSLTAAFASTTASFAVMLSALLVSLGIAAQLVRPLKKRKIALGLLVGAAGIFILLATPLIERFDMIDSLFFGPPLTIILNRFVMTLYVTGLPVTLLGLALPWLLDEADSPRDWAKLYAFNSLSAIAGAVGAAWLLLPSIGFARTAWLAGLLVAGAGLRAAPKKNRRALIFAVLAALAVAAVFESGAGRTRTQGHLIDNPKNPPQRILESFEGPEATVSAIEFKNGGRALVIDGFVAASQMDIRGKSTDHYMAWMGALPMLLQDDPRKALVLCFGTGQTVNAVRNENPQTVDVVDINPRVFRLAPYFDANENVLGDKRVLPVVMDGRAWLRRTQNLYDIITLEPMPPNFAGVNALYSREFYALARGKLSPRGIIAQWVPFHLVGPLYIASIVRTFREAFPGAVLWLDPVSRTGILLGAKDPEMNLGTSWPGFARNPFIREYPDKTVRDALFLDRRGVELYAAHSETITDDNQLLAYGPAVDMVTQAMKKETYDALNEARRAAENEKPENKRKPLKPWEIWP